MGVMLRSHHHLMKSIPRHASTSRRMASSSSSSKHLFLMSRRCRETKTNYFSLKSTEDCGAARDFRSPHFGYYDIGARNCNGLVLLHTVPNAERLWNPWTNEFKLLPPSYVPRPPNKSFYTFSIVGFGFDPKSSDYKVLRLVRNYFGDCCDDPHIQMELYSLKNDSWKEIRDDPYLPFFEDNHPLSWFYLLEDDSSWKKILEDPTHPYFTSDCANGCCYYANGCCYWVTEKKNILSFDFASESFSCFSLPKTGLLEFVTPFHCSKIDGIECSLTFEEFDGLLGVIVYVSSRQSARVQQKVIGFDGELWIQNDGSWTRKLEFHVPTDDDVYSRFWCSSDGKLFIWGRERSGYINILVYDLRTQEMNKFDIYDHCPRDRLVNVFPYVETIVDFNGK